MKLRMSVLNIFQILFTGLTTYVSSLPPPASPVSTSPEVPSSLTIGPANPQCQLVEEAVCSTMYNLTQLPNLYGDKLSKDAGMQIHEVLNNFHKGGVLVAFFCTLYLPPCFDGTSQGELADSQMAPLPCRPLCELAFEKSREFKILNAWPVRCNSLPTENCFNIAGPNNVTLVKTSMNAGNIKTLPNGIARFASLDVELGDDASYDVEVLTPSAGAVPERRYDIADLGDPVLFQGWADVQGSGAANDYCRVIGRGKRRFMSCNLSGTTGQGHHYVSKLGFEIGFANTWFMRDMDGDGRDDYCRCVGTPSKSKMTCMKAGEHGFFGSSVQGGYQHTFSLPGSEGCSSRRYNPVFGEELFVSF